MDPGAILTGVAAVLTAGNLWRRHSKSQAEMRSAIGTPNGRGNVVQMLETMLDRQDGMDQRLTRLEARAFRGGRK